MYEQFYGFKEKPFQVDPSPGYLYLSRKHQNALSYLEYGLTENMGIIMLSGEAGSGKTTLSHHLAERLQPIAEIAFISNPNSSSDQLLGRILRKYGLSPKKGQAATIDVIKQFIQHNHTQQKRAIIVVDDAHNLSHENLEEVRMLSDIRTENQALLQFMLVGEPEFTENLKISRYRSLARRISVRYQLTGLDSKDTGKYISFQLQKAGGAPALFSPEAVDEIYRITRGIPRSINLQCQMALVCGYVNKSEKIDKTTIEQIAREKISIGIELDFDNREAPAVADSKKEDEILRRLGFLEQKINVLQGYSHPRFQIEDQSNENFKDKLINQLLQLLIIERQNYEELLWHYSQQNYNLKTPNRSERAIQNDDASMQNGVGTAEYISFDQKKRRRFSE